MLIIYKILKLTMIAKKVVFVGNAQTGKSKIRRQLMNEQVQHSYVPTLGVEVFPYTQNGRKYNLWDCGGCKKLTGSTQGYCKKGDIFFIFTGGLEDQNPSNYGYKTSEEYENDIRGVVPNAIIHVVHNPFLQQIKNLLI